ncbi:virion morphogenesis protein [Orf virus]|uniref:Virion morphogenesis n=1 Tax=Orf virus TaxID=10258 RepID=D2D3T2_ORFV|nr:virion morphogenesis [Orf virus]ACS83755.1 virion morphogenesis [Orf virus]AKU76860.1 Virion morphogenesis [Orf virus]AYM26047.1 virion morphogenesis [Orf virus]QLI57745.1 virion morphogenesis protein [Orf virus]
MEEDLNEAALLHMLTRIAQICGGDAAAAAAAIKMLMDLVNERIMILNKKAKKEMGQASSA